MPKLKTRKSAIKKVRITKRRKVMRRMTNQNHFNSKETGQKGRKKRRDLELFKTDAKNILRELPNN